MKELPFKEAMRELREYRKIVHVTSRLSTFRDTEIDDGNYVDRNVRYKITYGARFTVTMHASDEGPALVAAQEKAVRIMIHDLYGPLRDDLVELLHHMWEDDYHGPAEEKLVEILELFR